MLLRSRILLIVLGLLIGLATAEAILFVIEEKEARSLPTKHFSAEPDAPATLRLAILGGSTAAGSPYSDVLIDGTKGKFNLLSLTQFLLHQRGGAPPVAIDNYSGPNWSVETAVDHYFEAPGAKPDILVLYTGQNEISRYYTPNMTPPPAWLAGLARLRTGRLALRRLYTRQVAPEDHVYRGDFFSRNVIPPYEREHNLKRFRHNVERIIRHCRKEGILPVIFIPESNPAFPPMRSIYDGPAERKQEALDQFRQAVYLKAFENNPAKAEVLLRPLLEFCSFADLHFELGEILYQRGAVAEAAEQFRRARESDGFPTAITPTYRKAILEVVEKEKVPLIDMQRLLIPLSASGIPDYSVFLDDCHLSRRAIEALSTDLVRLLDKHGLTGQAPGANPNTGILNGSNEIWAAHLGIGPEQEQAILGWEAHYHERVADYGFLRTRQLARALAYVREAGDTERTADLQEKLDSARRTELAWTQGKTLSASGSEFHPGKKREESPFGNNSMVELSRAISLAEKGAVEEAAECFRHLLKSDPRNAKAHYAWGQALLRTGRTEEAMEHYRKTIEIEPGNADLRGNVGVDLLSLGRVDDALREFHAVLEAEPDNARAHYNIGTVLYELGRHEEAIAHFRKALASRPLFAMAETNWGSALFALGRLDEAIEHFRRAVEIEPANADWHHNLAFACMRQGNLPLAAEHWQRATEIQPQNPKFKACLKEARQGLKTIHRP